MPKFWGIINLTPDSFSDGGELSSINLLKDRIIHLKKNCCVLDFGAESTAPFNKPLSVSEELGRYEQLLFPLLRSEPDLFRDVTLSIDTYHLDTIEQVCTEIKRDLGRDFPLIWNDVSGVWDESAEKIVQDRRLHYVFCHTHVSTRDQTSFHMDYLQDCEEEEFLDTFFHYFDQFKKRVSDKLRAQIIYDPCFGFSKTYQQNWSLLENMERLLTFFKDERLLIGISRKSFLKKKIESRGISPTRRHLDQYHKELLDRWKKNYNIDSCEFRVHNSF